MCTDVKMSLGQDAECSPSQLQQRPLIAVVTLQRDSIKNVHWSLAGVVYAETGIVFPLLSLWRTWDSACDIYCSKGTKALLFPQQSIFISCSNKSSEQGGNKRYDRLVCQALSSSHCCASMSPPTLYSFGTAKPLIAFVALIRDEVLQLGCLSFPPLFCSLQCNHIFICI